MALTKHAVDFSIYTKPYTDTKKQDTENANG
jgi:hypothetical protein